MVSPGSVQREQHRWARGPSTRLGPGQRPASRERPGALQAGDRAGQGPDRSEGLPCPKGWLGSAAEDQDLRPLLEPSLSLLME